MTARGSWRLRVVAWYAQCQGWPVFPCSEDKRPLVPHGFHDASRDCDQLEEWWTRWPDALIAAATGGLSGAVVIDIDRKNGVDGIASLIAAGLSLGATWTARTRSGGLHYYFRRPGHKIDCGASITYWGQKLPGVDIRADGGYAIVPGPRDGWRWTARRPGRMRAAPCPEWLLDWQRQRDTPPPPPRIVHPAPSGSRALDRIAETIVTAPVGSRQHTLAAQSWHAGRLAAEGKADASQARDAVLQAARCIGGGDWSAAAALRTAQRQFEAGCHV